MEIRMAKVVASGRLASDPVQVESGAVHFQLQATPEGRPFHCFCVGRTAENLMRFCHRGDELTIEGTLENVTFAGEKTPKMLIRAEFGSYGRKRESLQPGDIRGGIRV